MSDLYDEMLSVEPEYCNKCDTHHTPGWDYCKCFPANKIPKGWIDEALKKVGEMFDGKN